MLGLNICLCEAPEKVDLAMRKDYAASAFLSTLTVELTYPIQLFVKLIYTLMVQGYTSVMIIYMESVEQILQNELIYILKPL